MYCSSQFGYLDQMQGELSAEHPQYDIHILGVNEKGQEFANDSITEGRDLPWLQDIDSDRDGKSDVWTAWDITWRDVVILDSHNEVVATYNLTDHDLADSENYSALKTLFEQAVEAGSTSEVRWQNPVLALDVNGDEAVSPIDALLVINELNTLGAHELHAGTDDPPPPFLDTSGDSFVSPLDAILVLNELNARSLAPAAAVEASAVSADLFFALDDDDPYL